MKIAGETSAKQISATQTYTHNLPKFSEYLPIFLFAASFSPNIYMQEVLAVLFLFLCSC